MKKNDKIYIAGHTGLLGSALAEKLKDKGFTNLLLRTKRQINLAREETVKDFLAKERPDYVFLAAGKSGGISANSAYPAEFIYETLKMEANIIHYAYASGVKKLLYIGCSCIYPKDSPQPMKEEDLLKGPFEPTSEMFAVAKLAGLKMSQAYNQQYQTNFICCITENLFGPNDKFNPQWAHVTGALIERFHQAKLKQQDKLSVWGSGRPKRSFMYIEDAAEALIFLMEHYDSAQAINVGSNLEISIADLAILIKDIVGFRGEIVFDTSQPDGAPRKILDIAPLAKLGWQGAFSLEEGIKKTYQWYLRNR